MFLATTVDAGETVKQMLALYRFLEKLHLCFGGILIEIMGFCAPTPFPSIAQRRRISAKGHPVAARACAWSGLGSKAA